MLEWDWFMDCTVSFRKGSTSSHSPSREQKPGRRVLSMSINELSILRLLLVWLVVGYNFLLFGFISPLYTVAPPKRQIFFFYNHNLSVYIYIYLPTFFYLFDPFWGNYVWTLYVCIYIYISVYIYICIHYIYIYRKVCASETCKDTCIVRLHRNSKCHVGQQLRFKSPRKKECIYICICMYIYIYVHISLYIYMYV